MPGWQRAAAVAPVDGGTGATILVKLSPRVVERCRRRMRFLCDLVVRERSSLCPINGLVQAVPLEWSERRFDQDVVTAAVAADLDMLHDGLGLQFPLTVFLPGVEKCDGFSELMERCVRIDGRFRDSRAGSKFPAGAPVNDEMCEWVVARAMQWLSGWIYEAFARDLDSPANRRMFYLLCTLSSRQQRLKAQLERCFHAWRGVDRREPPRLAGWYFGAVGEGTSQQGFVGDVLRKLLGEQNEVAWSARTLDRDRRARRLASVLSFVAVALLVMAGIFFVYRGYFQSSGKQVSRLQKLQQPAAQRSIASARRSARTDPWSMQTERGPDG